MRRIILASFLSLVHIAFANDLLGVYQDALQNSPLPKEYLASYNKIKEGTPIAVGALLPQVAITANGVYTQTNTANGNYTYPSAGYSLTLTQPLFNYSNYAAVSNAVDNSHSAAATYQSNMQNFMFTVAEDYFNVLLAEDNVNFAQSQINSLKAILDQTKAKFSVGLATYTDVLQAKANYDSAVSTLLSNQNALNNANQALIALTNKPESNLAALKGNFPFAPPDPDDVDFWVSHSIQNNQALIAQRYTTKAALANVNEIAGAQLPTISLEASYGQDFYRESVINAPPPVSLPPHKLNASVELALNWTIFSGGEQMASSLQAADQYASLQNTELGLYRQTVTQTRQDFLSVLANIAQVQAYILSVQAAQSSLNDDIAKYKVGTSTIVKVLNDTQTLYEAKSNLANAAYQYISSLLQLKLDAGTLNQQDLLSLNQYLQVIH